MKNINRLALDTWHCLYHATVKTVTHDGIEHAGYLAFLGLLALFPFLVLIFSIVGLVGGGETGAAYIHDLLTALPQDVAAALQPRIVEITSGPPQGLLTVSILGAIWTASSGVEGLRTVLNRAYHVASPPAYWRRRSLSVLQLLFFTFIVVAGMFVLVAVPLTLRYVGNWLGIHFPAFDGEYVGDMARLATVGLLFCAVSYIYYVVPNLKQRFISVAPGALVVVLMWLASAYLFALYLSNFNQVELIYGSLGGVIAALLFFYICNVIFIFGAELNHQIVEALGLRIDRRE